MAEKSKRTRSPSYPVFNLETAVERAKEFYEAENFNEALVEVAAQSWDLTPGGSAGARGVAALLNFGLFEDEGTGKDRVVFLTELGKTIVLDERENSEERKKALKKAALNPTIFKQLWDKWGANLPSEANMRYFLIRELGFNPKHVNKFIDIFQSTIEYANLLSETEIEVSKEHVGETTNNEEKVKSDFKTAQTNEIKNQPSSNTDNVLNLPIPLICGERASLQIPIPLTDADFKLLKNSINTYLDSMKPAIVSGENKKDE